MVPFFSYQSTLESVLNNLCAIIMTRQSMNASDSLFRKHCHFLHETEPINHTVSRGCGGNSNRFMRRAHCRNRCVKQPNKPEVQELKHRRTVTSTTSTPFQTVNEESTVEPSATKRLPVTLPVKKLELVQVRIFNKTEVR